MWIRVVLVLAIVGIAWVWWWPRHDDLARVAPEPTALPSAMASPAQAPLPAGPRTAGDAAADEFESTSEESGVVANPVRDGLAILVLDANRQPLARASLDVRWRKGWGLYGNDRGRTDARGRFATTVAEHEMLEGITLHDPGRGDLEFWNDLLPMADDPRTVLVIAADVEPVTVRIVDQRSVPVAGATLEYEGGKVDAAPREHVLRPGSDKRTSAADGSVALRLAASAYEFKVSAEGYDSLYKLHVTVPRGGRTFTMHVLDRRDWHDVAVTVRLPEGQQEPSYLSGHTIELPVLPGREAEGIEETAVQLSFQRVADHYVFRAPPLRWRCGGHLQGNWSSVEVGAFDTAATLELKAPSGPPVARLKCKLLLPNGATASGEVMVHSAPDLVHGARHPVSEREPVVQHEPGIKVCVSAWVYRYPPVILGPIDLAPGEQELTFQFLEPLSIRGQIVDENGKPARGTAYLRRPAGPLRSLGNDVPEILPDSASGDSLGTGDQGEGRFWFENVGAGAHEIHVTPQGGGWPARVRAMPGDQSVVVRLGTGIEDMVRVQGRVTVAGTGQPIAGARVRLQGEHWNGEAYTDADGRYTQVAKPGRLHFEVWGRRCAVLQGDDREFAAGLVTEDLVLTPSEPLFVRVHDADGKVPDVEISARDDKGREIPFLDANGNWDGDSIDVGKKGKAVLRGLPATKFTLILTANGDDDAKKATMAVEVPANTPRDKEFAIVWAPARK